MVKKNSLFIIFLFLFIAGNSQEIFNEKLPVKEADTVEVKAIPLADLSHAMNNAQNDLKSFKDRVNRLSALANIDSVYTIGKYRIEVEKQMLLLNESQFGQREISDALKEWNTYASRVNKWINLTSSNLSTIEVILIETDRMLKIWNITLEKLTQEDINYSLRATAYEVSKQIQKTQQEFKQKQDEIIIEQDKLNSLFFEINEVIYSLQTEEKRIKTEYFKRVSPPIWNLANSVSDTINAQKSFKNSIKRQERNFTIFYRAYSNKFVLHIFLFILLIIGIYYQNKIFKPEPDETNELRIISKEVVSKYFLSALIFSITLSMWIYPLRQNAINDLLQLFLLLASFNYLARGSRKKKKFLSLTILLFFFNQIHIFLNGYIVITRPVLLLESIFSAWVLFMLISPKSEIRQELELRHWKFIIRTVPILILFSVISFFANISGYTNLANLLSETASNSIFNAISIVLATLIVRSIVVAILQSSLSKFSRILKNKGNEIEKKSMNIIQFFAVLIWIKTILINLTIYDVIYDWLAGLFKLSFNVGKTEIILGNFFIFMLIIAVTVYITKFVKLILEEEVFPRITLPRGIPGATSMVVGYILAGLGGYLAISAAGVDLKTFGLVVGALSVGIGFGLQGVVLNFISGIILAFERPVQVGDTVELGTLTGEVKSIGVRASKIRTYDGMEVVVPNGNLISNNLINWTLSDRKRRYDVNVGVAYGTDPHLVLNLLKKVANENADVLKYPEPWALFDGFGESSLNFRVRIWTSIDTGLQAKSDVTVAINDALKAAGIEIPFPQRDLHIRKVDKSEKKSFNAKNETKEKKTKLKKDNNSKE